MEVRLFVLKNYSNSNQFTVLERNFSDIEDILSEEEEDILEFTEIFQMLLIPLPTFLKEKFDSIVEAKKIPVRKSTSSNKFKTFFVYTENKILSQICDMLSARDICRIYESVREDKEGHEEFLEVINISLDEDSLKDIPGLKDTAFYYLILQMIDLKQLNRLHTHAIEYFLNKVIKKYKADDIQDIQRLDKAIEMLSRYPVSSDPPGICIIFCTEEGRKGSEDDLKRVKALFENKYRYDVIPIINPSSKDVQTIVGKLQSPRNKFYDSLVVWFMGHGNLNSLELSDRMIDRRKEFIQPLSDIDWLNKKPKLFFIQACSSEQVNSSFCEAQASRTAIDMEVDAVGIRAGHGWRATYARYVDTSCINNYADLLVSYATKWNEAASRQEKGSLYVNTVVDQLLNIGHIKSIESVLHKIHYYTNSVLLLTDYKTWKQTPYYDSSLQKEFVFPAPE
ncbi:rRNA 2'-O-methyltransferase fibrillarin [Armadillidium vulgare]|nr:rRNA 2'-O-methyltransferase fibrillarin [Armadillidium vulgare]